MLAEVEEKMNTKKTANADTGMMGFYKMLNKATTQPEEQVKQDEMKVDMKSVPAMSTRDKIENSLSLLKQKQ